MIVMLIGNAMNALCTDMISESTEIFVKPSRSRSWTESLMPKNMILVSIAVRMSEKPHDNRCTRVNVECGGHAKMLIQRCSSRSCCSDLTRSTYLNWCSRVTCSSRSTRPSVRSGDSQRLQTKCHVSCVCRSRIVIWLRNLQRYRKACTL